ncbi:DUF3888 domain-containing protein [Paenibacillus glycanilyticus]|uniref:DUF3888 domain-containing protein n=1 Tax=Paenibacillus glycanilyticus TaxID=126569 RepID=UPI00203B5455|nr:DUF3888 domain-containing protein [Paenibacillus glycanilyticus]MCM3631660.1 DUF3888 domain-containing protein [Paenibacillus glycanilyticus]
MKKYLKYLTLSIAVLVCFSVTQTSATYAHPKGNTVYKTMYATTEDIFLDTIHSKLNKFVLNQYGKQVHWYEPKIVEINRLVSQSKCTYQATIMIKVQGENNVQDWGIDQITLNYDSPYQNSEVNDTSLEPKIELIDYKHVTPLAK